MVDVWSVLPALTEAFQVRVQLFTHAEDRSRWVALREERPEIEHEWPGYETVLPSELVGPAADGEGIQTPVLRLYWRGGHFEPVFDDGGPVRQLLAEIEGPLDGLPPDAAEVGPLPKRRVNSCRHMSRSCAFCAIGWQT